MTTTKKNKIEIAPITNAVLIHNPTDEQTSKIKLVQRMIYKIRFSLPNKLTDGDRKFLNDSALWAFRFLRQYQWDLEVVKKQLLKTIPWRVSTRPDEIKWSDFEEVGAQGWMFQKGNDSEGRPLIYMLLGEDKYSFDSPYAEQKYKQLTYHFENGVKSMRDGALEVIWIVDLQDASVTLSLIKNMIMPVSSLGEHYPSTFHRVFICNPSTFHMTIWTVLQWILGSEITSCYTVIQGGPKEFQEQFEKFNIPQDQVIERMHGTLKFDYKNAFKIKQKQ